MEYAMFNRVLMVLRSRCRPILSPRLLPIMLACSLLPAGAREASAQNITNNTPDQSLRSNFEVNPSTLGLELGLTLGNYPGRGASMPVTLNYSSKTWRVIYLGEGEEQLPDGTTQTYLQVNPEFAEKSVSGWITNLAPPTTLPTLPAGAKDISSNGSLSQCLMDRVMSFGRAMSPY